MPQQTDITSVFTDAIRSLPAGAFIGGQWREGSSDKTTRVTYAHDGAAEREFSACSQADIDEAYSRALEAQAEWAATPPPEKAAILSKAADLLDEHRNEVMAALRLEAGSSALKAGIETDSAIGITREAASFPGRSHGTIHPSMFPGKENRVYREPRGVVTVISPWNFPLHLSIRSVSPALALGNAVVLKPASDTIYTGGLLIAKIFDEAGLPEGLLSVVPGSGSEIGDYIVEHPTPDMVSFTGSTPVGKHVAEVAANSTVKHVALELGGNAPVVVLDDADIDQAVSGSIVAAFLHQGQICMAANRLIVDESIYDEFVERFSAKANELVSGVTTDDDVIIGPIINDDQVESVTSIIESAEKEGARLTTDGGRDGRVIRPHVFADVTEDMTVAKNEIFGPAIGIIKASGEEDALRLANDTEFGLSSAVFTRDVQRGVRVARRIKAGMTHINDSTVNDEPHVMFGGEKSSGIGRFNGEQAIEDFTTLHWIGVRDEMGPAPF